MAPLSASPRRHDPSGRDEAVDRVRRTTRWVVASAVLGTGVLVGVAAHELPAHSGATTSTGTSGTSTATSGTSGGSTSSGTGLSGGSTTTSSGAGTTTGATSTSGSSASQHAHAVTGQS